MNDYSSTAEEVAEYLTVDASTIKQWAKLGYPIRINGNTVRVRLEGCIPNGKKYGFNKKAVLNFLERMGDEEWVRLNVNTNSKMVLPPKPKTGQLNSILMESDTAKQLRELTNSQRNKQTNSATN